MPSLSIHKKLTLLSLPALFAGALFVGWQAGGPGSAQAQEPSPTPTRTATPAASPTPAGTATPGACVGNTKGTNQTVPAVSGATVRLPAGGSYDVIINPPGAAEPTFTVCHAESQARVTINAVTCREISESVPNQSGAILIAQIVESCTTGAAANPTAAVTQTPGGITPPNTGDAGLADSDQR